MTFGTSRPAPPMTILDSRPGGPVRLEKMLTQRPPQLHYDYLQTQNLPVSSDTKTSPLALLAATCSSIGRPDSNNNTTSKPTNIFSVGPTRPKFDFDQKNLLSGKSITSPSLSVGGHQIAGITRGVANTQQQQQPSQQQTQHSVTPATVKVKPEPPMSPKSESVGSPASLSSSTNVVNPSLSTSPNGSPANKLHAQQQMLSSFKPYSFKQEPLYTKHEPYKFTNEVKPTPSHQQQASTPNHHQQPQQQASTGVRSPTMTRSPPALSDNKPAADGKPTATSSPTHQDLHKTTSPVATAFPLSMARSQAPSSASSQHAHPNLNRVAPIISTQSANLSGAGSPDKRSPRHCLTSAGTAPSMYVDTRDHPHMMTREHLSSHMAPSRAMSEHMHGMKCHGLVGPMVKPPPPTMCHDHECVHCGPHLMPPRGHRRTPSPPTQGPPPQQRPGSCPCAMCLRGNEAAHPQHPSSVHKYHPYSPRSMPPPPPMMTCRDPNCNNCSSKVSHSPLTNFLHPALIHQCTHGTAPRGGDSMYSIPPPPPLPSSGNPSQHGPAPPTLTAESYLKHSPLTAESYLKHSPNSKAFVCNWVAEGKHCGQSFPSSEELFQHLRTHTSLQQQQNIDPPHPSQQQPHPSAQQPHPTQQQPSSAPPPGVGAAVCQVHGCPCRSSAAKLSMSHHPSAATRFPFGQSTRYNPYGRVGSLPGGTGSQGGGYHGHPYSQSVPPPSHASFHY